MPGTGSGAPVEIADASIEGGTGVMKRTGSIIVSAGLLSCSGFRIMQTDLPGESGLKRQYPLLAVFGEVTE